MVLILPGSTSSRSIVVQTALGNNIDNSQIYELSEFDKRQFSPLERKYPSARFKDHEPTAVYNCHGMTFACRRTGIFEPKEINKIIKEDNYKKILVENVQPGDIIIYLDDDLGDIEHSGIVVSFPVAEEFNIPWICSKWGKYKEAIHRANHCPYNKTRIEYYRVKYE